MIVRTQTENTSNQLTTFLVLFDNLKSRNNNNRPVYWKIKFAGLNIEHYKQVYFLTEWKKSQELRLIMSFNDNIIDFILLTDFSNMYR